MKMRKLYGVLLLTLFTVSSVWSEEQPTLFGRTRQFTVRLKEKCLRKVKQQYQDKQKRRWWISSGVIGLAGFLSWKFGAFHKIWKRKSKPTSADAQPPRKTKRRTSKGKSHRKKRKKKTSSSSATTDSKVRFDGKQPSSSRAPGLSADGTTRIRGDQEAAKEEREDSFAQGGSIVMHDDAPANDLGSYHAPEGVAAIGAEGLEAALGDALQKVGKKNGYRLPHTQPDTDTLRLVPLFRKNVESGLKPSEAKRAVMEKVLRDPAYRIDHSKIEQQLGDAAFLVKKQKNAKGKFEKAVRKNNLSEIVDALIDGSNAIEPNDSFIDSIFAYVKNNRLSNKEQTAFDLILWHLRLPAEIKQTLFHRTIKKIAPSERSPIPDAFLHPSQTSNHMMQ